MMTSCAAAQAASRRIGTNEEAHRIPLQRLGQVEDCAGVLEFLATDLSQYVRSADPKLNSGSPGAPRARDWVNEAELFAGAAED